MFWQKCGKLILIDCDTCPCPYWGIFLFLRRPYNQATGAINYCDVSASIQIKNVFNNCITYNFGHGDVDIRISLNASGVVGTYHGCMNSTCVDVQVYKLSNCFETQAEAQAYYNSFNIDYWDNMASKYTNGIDITFNTFRYYDSFYGPFVEQCESSWECYDMQTGDVVYTGPTYPDIPPGEQWECFQYWGECTTYCITTGSGEKIGLMDYELHPDMQEYMGECIETLNQLVEGELQTPSNWPLYQTNTNGNRCFNISYDSGYNYWGQDDGCPAARWMWATRGEIAVQGYNANKHPAGATGVRLKLNYTIQQTNSDCTTTTSTKTQTVTLQFGQTYDLTQIADNLDQFIQVQCWQEFIGFKSNPCSGKTINVLVQFIDYEF